MARARNVDREPLDPTLSLDREIYVIDDNKKIDVAPSRSVVLAHRAAVENDRSDPKARYPINRLEKRHDRSLLFL